MYEINEQRVYEIGDKYRATEDSDPSTAWSEPQIRRWQTVEILSMFLDGDFLVRLDDRQNKVATKWTLDNSGLKPLE